MAFETFEAQLKELKKAESRLNIRGQALLVAFENNDVLNLLKDRVGKGHIYNGAQISVLRGYKRLVRIMFKLIPKENDITIYSPNFSVLVSLESKKVIEIVENLL